MDLNVFGFRCGRYKQFIEFVGRVSTQNDILLLSKVVLYIQHPSSIDMIKKLFDRFIPASKDQINVLLQNGSHKLTELMKI
jgi:cobalamin biosynthesis Co2+ chelatase CbiK